MRFSRLFLSKFYRNNNQRNCYQNQSSRNLSAGHNVPDINTIHFDLLSKRKAIHAKTIPNTIERVKVTIPSSEKTGEKPGEIRINPNHPAARLPEIPEKTRNQVDLSFLLDKSIIIVTVTESFNSYKDFAQIDDVQILFENLYYNIYKRR